MLVGSGLKGQGGTALVYKSRSLLQGAPVACACVGVCLRVCLAGGVARCTALIYKSRSLLQGALLRACMRCVGVSRGCDETSSAESCVYALLAPTHTQPTHAPSHTRKQGGSWRERSARRPTQRQASCGSAPCSSLSTLCQGPCGDSTAASPPAGCTRGRASTPTTATAATATAAARWRSAALLLSSNQQAAAAQVGLPRRTRLHLQKGRRRGRGQHWQHRRLHRSPQLAPVAAAPAGRRQHPEQGRGRRQARRWVAGPLHSWRSMSGQTALPLMRGPPAPTLIPS